MEVKGVVYMRINNNFQTNSLWSNVKKNEVKTRQTQTGISINMANKKERDSIKLNSDMTEKLRKLELEEKGIIASDSFVSKSMANLGEMQNNIQKISDLAKASQKSFVTQEDKKAIEEEIKSYQKEIDKISNDKAFDNLRDSVDKLKSLTTENEDSKLADDEKWLESMSILSSISNNSSETLGLNDISISSQEEAQKALSACKAAQSKISTQFITLSKFKGVLENIDSAEVQDFLQGATSLDEVLDYSQRISKNHNVLSSNKLELYKLNYLYTNGVE